MKTLAFVIILITSWSCMPLSKHIASREHKSYLKKSEKICEMCNNKYLGKDTLFLNRSDVSKICVYVDGKVHEYGTIRKGKRKGKWFVFEKNELEFVVSYDKNGEKRIVFSKKIRPLINESW